MAINWFKYSAPTTFYGLAGKLIPWFALSAAILFAIGLYIGFVVAPVDAQQGEFYRIGGGDVAPRTLRWGLGVTLSTLAYSPPRRAAQDR